MVEQRLRLSPAQFAHLAAFLDQNALPENAAYRYRFLDDNCTTRARDAVEQAIGQRINGTTNGPGGTAPTFRDLLDPYQTGAPLMLFGTTLGLGMGVDAHASPRQAQFLPDVLLRDFDASTAGGQPLVTRTDTLVNLPRPAEHAFPWPVLVGLLVLAASVVQTWRRRASPVVTRFDRALLAVAGGAGLLLAFLVFVSLHDVTRPNLNLAWALPTHLVYAFVAGRAASGGAASGRAGRWTRRYALATGLLAAAFAVASPLLPQTVPLAIVPVAAALALRLLAHAGVLPGRRANAPPVPEA